MTPDFKLPIKLGTKEFHQHRLAIYEFLREEHPVSKGRISLLNVWLVARYADCVELLKDERMRRDRSAVTGKRRLPFPLPRSVQRLAISMIYEDDPNHRRLRNLVHKAFTPRALTAISDRVATLTEQLLEQAHGTQDLTTAYSLPIPVTVIREMLGVEQADMDDLRGSLSALSDGLSGFTVIKTLLVDMSKANRFIERKKAQPADDILSGLIAAEEQGDRLSQDELVAMVFLLIIAGYETTVHLINNAVVTLLTHREQWEQLRAEPELIDSAVEEILRFSGPIEGTKPFYPTEAVTYSGTIIPKGAMVMPLLGAANRDPRQFEQPDVFDITRSPNKHLGFSHGIHYCLGAPLARLETRIALQSLLQHKPNIRLAVPASQLNVQRLPGWVRYTHVPVSFD